MTNNISSDFINKVLKERPITSYLDAKGFIPSRETQDKKVYLCPVHEGDTSPSMTVFLDGEYQTYYCFGCHSGINIINLISDVEKITTKEAFKKICKGIKMPESSYLDNIEDIETLGISSDFVDYYSVEEVLFKIGSICYDFLEMHFNLDQKEVVFFEEIWKKADKMAMEQDKDSLDFIYNFLVEKGLPKKAKMHYQQQEQQVIKKVKENKIWEDM